MAQQGTGMTSSQPSTGNVGNGVKNMAQTDVKKEKSAPSATNVAAVATMKMDTANLKKMVSEKAGIKKMANAFGVTNDEVKEALKANGMKTLSMEKEAMKISFGDMRKIYAAIENGCGNTEDIAELTGIDRKVVASGVRKLKREGEVGYSLVVLKAQSEAQTGQTGPL